MCRCDVCLTVTSEREARLVVGYGLCNMVRCNCQILAGMWPLLGLCMVMVCIPHASTQ
jgi:hypothetical protein